jgi:hypothetical protein
MIHRPDDFHPEFLARATTAFTTVTTEAASRNGFQFSLASGMISVVPRGDRGGW